MYELSPESCPWSVTCETPPYKLLLFVNEAFANEILVVWAALSVWLRLPVAGTVKFTSLAIAGAEITDAEIAVGTALVNALAGRNDGTARGGSAVICVVLELPALTVIALAGSLPVLNIKLALVPVRVVLEGLEPGVMLLVPKNTVKGVVTVANPGLVVFTPLAGGAPMTTYTLPLPPAAALLLILTPVPPLPLPMTMLPLAPVVILLFSNVMVAAIVFVLAAVVIEAGDTLSSTFNCAPAAMTDMAPLVAVKLLIVMPVPPALVLSV